MDVIEALADALDYPGPHLGSAVGACLNGLHPTSEEAVLLARFRDYVQSRMMSSIQEHYAATFDIDPKCCPYAGHHLLGDGSRRGMLMARLRQHYRERHFVTGKELPDHFSVLLRYIARNRHDADTAELISDCVLPALEKLTAELQKKSDPYADVTRAVSLVLGHA